MRRAGLTGKTAPPPGNNEMLVVQVEGDTKTIAAWEKLAHRNSNSEGKSEIE
jgi:hypothetical protein